jgi:hypothetical protein
LIYRFSFNRYLAKTQLFNPASVHCYIQALLKGCRCIESNTKRRFQRFSFYLLIFLVDVIDNRTGGEPEITHRNTRIRPIPLRDVLEAIMDYAFVTSEYEFKENKYFIFDLLIFRYPIIISIENHCSPEQRFNMSRMFIEIFGGKFYS